jgi:hypothetical protein
MWHEEVKCVPELYRDFSILYTTNHVNDSSNLLARGSILNILKSRL